MIIDKSDQLPPGYHVLWRNGDVVWFGPLGSPIEDVECDRITVRPEDYDLIVSATVPLTAPIHGD